ncbi:MAG: glycosyltransferase family 4 protein [Gammaproteobacteria bacterium]|nr:glycosyltransferase family 4 protein [Gammaproteobacteria bacterium]MBU1481737.1 glycosyltransferase family 4 protein [Gammaproteobacteria bacterium]
MTRPAILIASLMREQGWCGVQTHFRAVMGYARQQGYEVSLAEPYLVSRWIRKLPWLAVRLLKVFSRERAALLHRMFTFQYMRIILRKNLRMLKGRAVVIYAQDPLSASAALAMRREGFQFRLVAVLHFNISEAYEYQLNGLASEGSAAWRSLMRTEQEVLPQLDKVIFVSDYMRRIVLERNPALAEVQVEVIPNFPEHATAMPSANQPVRGDIISIGTLEPRKNQGYLLHVLAEARRRGYIYSLTLVGDGPSRAEWQVLAQQLGVAGQVQFLGYVTGASGLISGHRVFAHAARMESFGIVLVEAMSHALPIFAPAVGGIPEVFDDGVEGVLWPLDDAPGCAEKLIGILEDQQAFYLMSQAAAKRYQTRFAPDVLGPRWVSAITGEEVA